jgi:hypothetical protein
MSKTQRGKRAEKKKVENAQLLAKHVKDAETACQVILETLKKVNIATGTGDYWDSRPNDEIKFWANSDLWDDTEILSVFPRMGVVLFDQCFTDDYGNLVIYYESSDSDELGFTRTKHEGLSLRINDKLTADSYEQDTFDCWGKDGKNPPSYEGIGQVEAINVIASIRSCNVFVKFCEMCAEKGFNLEADLLESMKKYA